MSETGNTAQKNTQSAPKTDSVINIQIDWGRLKVLFLGWRLNRQLMTAVEKGDLSAVEGLLEEGAKPGSKKSFSPGNDNRRVIKTALILAAENGHTQIVQKLIEAGVVVDQTVEDNSKTALIYAAAKGHTEVVDALIAAGADVNKKSDLGYGREISTAIDAAARNGHTDAVRKLIAAGANVNIKDEVGQTPVLNAAKNGHADIVNALIAAKANVNIPSRSNEGPLFWAAFKGYTEIAESIALAGGNLDEAVETAENCRGRGKGCDKTLKRLSDLAEKLPPTESWALVGPEVVLRVNQNRMRDMTLKNVFDFKAGRVVTQVLSKKPKTAEVASQSETEMADYAAELVEKARSYLPEDQRVAALPTAKPAAR